MYKPKAMADPKVRYEHGLITAAELAAIDSQAGMEALRKELLTKIYTLEDKVGALMSQVDGLTDIIYDLDLMSTKEVRQ